MRSAALQSSIQNDQSREITQYWMTATSFSLDVFSWSISASTCRSSRASSRSDDGDQHLPQASQAAPHTSDALTPARSATSAARHVLERALAKQLLCNREQPRTPRFAHFLSHPLGTPFHRDRLLELLHHADQLLVDELLDAVPAELPPKPDRLTPPNGSSAPSRPTPLT